MLQFLLPSKWWLAQIVLNFKYLSFSTQNTFRKGHFHHPVQFFFSTSFHSFRRLPCSVLQKETLKQCKAVYWDSVFFHTLRVHVQSSATTNNRQNNCNQFRPCQALKTETTSPLQITESGNMLNQNGPVRVRQSSSWPYAEHSKSHTTCLRALSRHFWNSDRLGAVVTSLKRLFQCSAIL